MVFQRLDHTFLSVGACARCRTPGFLDLFSFRDIKSDIVYLNCVATCTNRKLIVPIVTGDHEGSPRFAAFCTNFDIWPLFSNVLPNGSKAIVLFKSSKAIVFIQKFKSNCFIQKFKSNCDQVKLTATILWKEKTALQSTGE